MTGKAFVVAPKAFVRGPNGTYLFLRRSQESKHFAGRWEMPGGKMDPGETLEDCLVRETEEETGLSICLTRVVGAAEGEIPQYRLAYLVMEGQAESETVQLSSEHDDFAWTTLANALTLPLCPAFRTLVEEFAACETEGV